MTYDNIIIQALIVFGSIVTTFLTVKYKNVLLAKNKVAPPKDRMDTIFEGYEKLIVQQQDDIQRKSIIINDLEGIVARLRDDLDKTSALLESARDEVRESKRQNEDMKRQLDELKKSYSVPIEQA